MTIQQVQAEVVEEFSFLKDWEERYAYLIDLGKELPLIDNQYKTDDYLIKGCQSKVWLFAQLADGKVLFTADSDAIITKGIVALLVRVFSGQAPEDIAKADTGFIDQIGLKEHLSPTRANGLVSMIEQMKRYAVAFSLMEK
ncbi:Cysteine desulfuration protein SufE [Capnocytophaga haemolytica]|uniref:Cysteine desulfuration protein sufE n=1 Tax=Capnocytophaga haemolytica TaxID=45243 RepID=A0AAX2GZ14_9FLAO|nr:SufE family protein [Capnocytophaga haemolytica]AMD84259.1 Fe-S metabolism protein SufE [Capnocytophaga haemolytica]SFN96003.1 Cysteine desulfuration protein SufE [Capnocytophaga haemolytica]SNV12255.1 Cysteine desulfuration protein sufE [Capnocytophaga haemolytica]